MNKLYKQKYIEKLLNLKLIDTLIFINTKHYYNNKFFNRLK